MSSRLGLIYLILFAGFSRLLLNTEPCFTRDLEATRKKGHLSGGARPNYRKTSLFFFTAGEDAAPILAHQDEHTNQVA